MSARELRLECLKAAVVVAPISETLSVAKEFWEFVSWDSRRLEHQHTEQPSSGIRAG